MRPLVSRFLSGSSADRAEDAVLGEPIWGPRALLTDVELRLGLPPPGATPEDRVQAYSSRLRAARAGEPFFARSLDVDPHGTAATLLSWRDELLEAGWSDAPVPNGGRRLEALTAVESSNDLTLPLGMADRLVRVEHELRRFSGPLYDGVRLLEPLEAWPGRWRSLFASLDATVDASAFAPSASAADSDLGQAQRALSSSRTQPTAWRGDGSVRWLRARTSWELGEAVVGLARSLPTQDVLFVTLGDEAPLEAALASQGLPTLGRSATSALRAPLQVLPLALSLLYGPRDPYRALELLTLPNGPIGRFAARRLASALAQAPGIGSDAWKAAKAPAKPDDPGSVTRAAEARLRIGEWLEGDCYPRGDGAPRAAIIAVAERVRGWAQTRPHVEGGDVWLGLAARARALITLLEAETRETLRPHELEPIVAQAMGGGLRREVSSETAGRFAHASSPHGVLRPHDAVIVWHAGHDASRSARRAPWLAAERAALASAGVALAEPSLLLGLQSRAAREMVLAALSTLIVATPDSDRGEPQRSLPVWDELCARCAPDAFALSRVTKQASALLESEGALPAPLLSTAAPLDLPEARPQWQVTAKHLSARLDAHLSFSPSQLEVLVACPFRWVVESLLGIRASAHAQVPDSARLYGILGHRLAEKLHERGALASEGAAQALTREELDALIEAEGGPLLLPGMSSVRAQVRDRLTRAMARLVSILKDSELRVVSVEQGVEAPWGLGKLKGRVDLLLSDAEGREAIIDLKWGEARYREALSKGEAVQLAIYSVVRQRQAGAPSPLPAAYLSLKTGRGLSLNGDPFRGTTQLGDMSLQETFGRVEATSRLVVERLRAGEVLASALADKHVHGKKGFLELHGLAGADLHDSKSDAACTYCSHGALCGRSFRTEGT